MTHLLLRKVLLAGLAVGLTLSGCDWREELPAVSESRAGDDAAVYAAVFDSLFGELANRSIGLQAQTDYPPPAPDEIDALGLHEARDGPQTLRPKTAADFMTRNREPASVPSIFPVQRAQLRVLAPDGPASRDTAIVSRIGYAPDRTQALVYVTFKCGALCGYGAYVPLDRLPSGAWAVQHVWTAWES